MSGGRRYPLRALLELRRREREAAEAELGRRVRSRADAGEWLGEADARLRALAGEDGGRPASGSLGREWHLYSGQVTAAIAAREKRVAELAKAEAALAEGRALYARASAREEALARHRDRFEREAADRLRKREEQAADDRAASRGRVGFTAPWS